MNFTLPSITIEQIELYSNILKKEPNVIIHEALEAYFVEVEKSLHQDSMESENRLTTFSNDEFWEGVDLSD